MHTPPLLSPAIWARDYAIIGLTVGSMSPFFVIFDPGFAVLAGLVGGATGALLGAGLAWALERVRGVLPLAVIVPFVAAVGSLWGALAGTLGGFGSLGMGVGAIPLGFVLGACTGMVTLGLGFLPHLMLATSGRSTASVVALGVLASPVMGWLGLIALAGATFGLWLFLVPVLAAAGVALDRSEQRAKRLSQRAAAEALVAPSAPVAHCSTAGDPGRRAHLTSSFVAL